MEDEKEEKPIIESSMSYIFLDKNGKEIESGECKGTIDKEYLTIFPIFGNILPFHLRDIIEVKAENYKIILPMESKMKLILSNLGLDFEDFLRVLINLRNEVMIKDLLMNEAIRKTDIEIEFVYYDENGIEKQKGAGKIRLYETGLVILPYETDIFRISYSNILNISKKDYEIILNTDFGEKIFLRKMGTEFEPFLKTLSEIFNELQNKSVSHLKKLFPEIDSISLRKIANLMKEGKAVKRVDIEAINKKVWLEIEKKILSTELSGSYKFLKEIARQEKVSIGFKRGLMSDLTGEYIWFLIPIYKPSEKYGNAIAMEATGEESTGKATYFFRIVSRKDYLNYKSFEEIDKEADNVIKKINQCMIDINFRREPIYIPDNKLEEPLYIKYKIAIRKIPSLRLLRNLYVGRVMHISQEQWKKDVMDLLRFNVETLDDSIKWKK